MRVLFNAVGFYADDRPFIFGAFIEADNGDVYWSHKTAGRTWSSSLDLPDTFRSQVDVMGSMNMVNGRVTGGSGSAAVARSAYAVAWREKRGEWSLQDLVSKGKITQDHAQKIAEFYGEIELEAAA